MISYLAAALLWFLLLFVFVLIISPFVNPAKLENGDIRDYSYPFFLFFSASFLVRLLSCAFRPRHLYLVAVHIFFCSTFHPFNSFLSIWWGPVWFGRLVGLVLPGLVNGIVVPW